MGKAAEKIRNWSAYNTALVEPGSLNIWIEQETLEGWYAKRAYGKNGRSFRYSDAALECALVVKTCYKLPLRALEGLLEFGYNSCTPLPIHKFLGAPMGSMPKSNGSRIVVLRIL